MDFTIRDRCICDEIFVIIYRNTETAGNYGLQSS